MQIAAVTASPSVTTRFRMTAMGPRSDYLVCEQVGGRTWAAIAVDAGGAVSNGGFVDLGGRALVVDAFFSPGAARDLRAVAEELAGPVELLVVTHAHFDHYGGAQVYADVPIAATARTREAISEQGPGRLEKLRSTFADYVAELEAKGAPEWEREQARAIGEELPGLELTLPTETFDERLQADDVEVLACGPGHTPSDSVVWVPDDRVLFAGDLVTVDAHPNLAHGDPENWFRILDRLDALGARRVVSGHGPVADGEAIEVVRRYIETLLLLAAEPGQHVRPAEYDGWAFPDGFEQNLQALRERRTARRLGGRR
jgi:cyclase